MKQDKAPRWLPFQDSIAPMRWRWSVRRVETVGTLKGRTPFSRVQKLVVPQRQWRRR